VAGPAEPAAGQLPEVEQRLNRDGADVRLISQEAGPDDVVAEPGRLPHLSFPLSASYSQGGFHLEVSEIHFLKGEDLIADMAAEGVDITAPLESPTYIALKIAAANRSESSSEWYPTEGMLMIGPEELERVMLTETAVDGGFRRGNTRNAFVFYGTAADPEELAKEGMAVLLGDPPSSLIGTPAARDVELQLVWSPVS
jgi:hypothetical protein